MGRATWFNVFCVKWEMSRCSPWRKTRICEGFIFHAIRALNVLLAIESDPSNKMSSKLIAKMPVLS